MLEWSKREPSGDQRITMACLQVEGVFSLELGCAGYEGYPFQNKQGKSCVENLANDVDKEEKIGVVVIISPLF